eukprot:7159083-Prymnesium_polylepis.1
MSQRDASCVCPKSRTSRGEPREPAPRTLAAGRADSPNRECQRQRTTPRTRHGHGARERRSFGVSATRHRRRRRTPTATRHSSAQRPRPRTGSRESGRR